jgi:RIO kinase 2
LKIYSNLSREEILVLRSLASLVKLYEHVPIEVIKRRTGLPETHVPKILRSLVGNRLIAPHKVYGNMYRPTFTGLNIASLHGLLRRGVIDALGDRIGVGKESLVYLAYKNGEPLIVKFHRIGIKSFRHVVRVRSYGEGFERLWWGARSVISAEREHRALEILSRVGARVPRPFGREYNAVVMEYIEGIDLYRAGDLENPSAVLEDIIDTARKAYIDAGIVHGDLSPFNVIVSRSGGAENGYVIDWPQWIKAGDRVSHEILRRDLRYIAEFFSKKYGLKIDPEDLFARVVGSDGRR